MPDSFLVKNRPDIWNRALTLATRVTGYHYAPKLPLPDGEIYACGGYAPLPIPRPQNPPPTPLPQPDPEPPNPTPAVPVPRERTREELNELIDELEERRRESKWHGDDAKADWLRGRIKKLKKERKLHALGPLPEPGVTPLSLRVFVPEGAMEWLLHEVGHWLAASPEERLLLNYGLSASEHGHDGEREWQAWAFEEIILAPFGPAREFAPPTQRDGAGFGKAGPMPAWALRHAERRITEAGVDVEQWRSLYREWIRFETGLLVPSWRRSN